MSYKDIIQEARTTAEEVFPKACSWSHKSKQAAVQNVLLARLIAFLEERRI